MKNEDVELVHRILAGDETAFVSLVEKYQKQVHALAWRKIGDFHIAEEITQDTFLKVYQKLATLKDPNQFSGWLYVIATRQCLTWLRKKRIETESLEETDTEWVDESAYSRYVAEEHAKTTTEAQREVVKKLLAKLKESERTVLTLHYFGEMTVEEISRFLGVSTSAIKLRLHRARQRLKKEEPMIREALSNFQLSPNLTDTIVQKIERTKPAAPSGSKPLVPWVIGASTAFLIVLMLGIGSQHLARFQQPYSLDAQSETAVELIEAPIVLNLEAKPDVRNQLGVNSDDRGEGDGTGQESNQSLTDKGNYTQWRLPENAKARLGKGAVHEVAYPSDGNRLAVASGTGIWLYDARTGQELDLLTGHTGSVLTVAFSPDGSTIASGSEDTTVMFWDAITGEHKQTLIGHENIVTSVAFNPKGDILASASFDATVRLWDVTTGKLKRKTLEARSSLTHIVFNPSGDTIAGSTLADNVVYLWDVATGKIKTTLEVDTQFAGDIAFSHDGDKIAINCSSDLNIQIWDVSTRQYQGTLRGHTTNTMDIVFSPDGNTLASVCLDGTLRLWNYNEEFLRDLRVGRNKPKTTFHIENMRWMRIIFSPDNSTIAGYDEDGTVLLLDAATGQQKTAISGHTNRVSSIAFSPGGNIIASGKGDQVLLWDVNTAELTESLNTAGLNIISVGFSPNGSTLATGHDGNTILLWDMETRQQKLKIEVPLLDTDIKTWIREVIFSPDGNLLASSGGYNDYSVYLWDVNTGLLKVKLEGHTDTVDSIAFSPNGRMLASCCEGFGDNSIKLWHVVTGQLIATLEGHTGGVFSVAFSPDGKTLASGAGFEDNSIKLWDISTVKNKETLKSGKGYVLCVAFSPDGRTLANGNSGRSVSLWDIATKQQIAVLTGHNSVVKCVAFSPDGKTLASGSNDGTILLWDLTSAPNTN